MRQQVYADTSYWIALLNPRDELHTKAVEALRGNRNVMVSPQTPEQFETALERYKQTADKGWSLTDCASFQIMEGEHIQAALTHDRHFAQAGYDALLR